MPPDSKLNQLEELDLQKSGENSRVHLFLIKIGVLLHRFGTPSHRLERVMTKLSQSLGVEGVFLYTPTALVLSITDAAGEATYLRRVDAGAVDVDKLIRFDQTLELLEEGGLTVDEASQRLDEIAGSAPPFPAWVSIMACAVGCAAVAVFFRGSAVEVMAAAILGLGVALLELVPAKLKWEPGLLEPVSGFIAALGALAFARFVLPIDDRLVTLAALIVMVPGLRITVAVTELAVGHLSAGVARLAGAFATLLTMTVGVGIGWRVAGAWRNIPDVPAWQLDWYWQWVAIVVAPITFAIVFRARWPQWPVIVAVSASGFISSMFAGAQWGIEVGALSGAIVVGIGSNLYARIRDRPALVPLTPGIIVLVPGSLGYKSLTALLDNDTMAGIDLAFKMVIVAVALVGGILTANAILPPKRIL